MGENSTSVEVNTSDPNAKINVEHTTTTSSGSSSSSSASNTTSYVQPPMPSMTGSVPPTVNTIVSNADDDDEPPEVNPPPPAPPPITTNKESNPLLHKLTYILIGLVVLYIVVFLAVRLFYPNPSKAREMAAHMNMLGKTSTGDTLGPNGELGFPCGTQVHRMKWVPRYGWLIDINKEFCKPRVGLCSDPTGEIPNKWCSYSCRLNLNSQTAREM